MVTSEETEEGNFKTHITLTVKVGKKIKIKSIQTKKKKE